MQLYSTRQCYGIIYNNVILYWCMNEWVAVDVATSEGKTNAEQCCTMWSSLTIYLISNYKILNITFYLKSFYIQLSKQQSFPLTGCEVEV